MSDQIWNYIVTAVGLAGFYLAGKKIWWAWYVNIANQVLWFTYGFVTEQWGFVVGTLFYTFVFVKNAISWTKEHFAPPPPKSIAPISLMIDTSAFEQGMKKAAQNLSKIKLTNRIGGWRDKEFVPLWERYFGWIRHPRNIGSHMYKTCTCYLTNAPVIGKIDQLIALPGEGMKVKAHLDLTTEAGRKAYDMIKAPVTDFSIPASELYTDCQSFTLWQGRHISCEVNEHPAEFPHEAILSDAMPPLRVKWDRFGHTTAEEISHAGDAQVQGDQDPGGGGPRKQPDRRPADC